MSKRNSILQILLPVYNEADSIEQVIREIYEEISPRVKMEFIISEDGSTDGTKEILRKLSKRFPIILISDKERKGYTRAVMDGLGQFSGKYLLCLDSDGQCDPKDFWKFWQIRTKADLIIGHRIDRQDNIVRKILSRGFYYFYKTLFPVSIHDPSCPFILTTQKVVKGLLPELGLTDQGFWWEFTARAYKHRFSFLEIPVNHRLRFAGETQVYKPRKMLLIGIKHAIALFKIFFQEASSNYSK